MRSLCLATSFVLWVGAAHAQQPVTQTADIATVVAAGESLLGFGLLDQAIGAFSSVDLAAGPEFYKRARLGVARCYEQQRQVDLALGVLSDYQANCPGDHIEIGEMRVDMLVDAGRWQEAHALVQLASSFSGQDPQARLPETRAWLADWQDPRPSLVCNFDGAAQGWLLSDFRRLTWLKQASTVEVALGLAASLQQGERAALGGFGPTCFLVELPRAHAGGRLEITWRWVVVDGAGGAGRLGLFSNPASADDSSMSPWFAGIEWTQSLAGEIELAAVAPARGREQRQLLRLSTEELLGQWLQVQISWALRPRRLICRLKAGNDEAWAGFRLQDAAGQLPWYGGVQASPRASQSAQAYGQLAQLSFCLAGRLDSQSASQAASSAYTYLLQGHAALAMADPSAALAAYVQAQKKDPLLLQATYGRSRAHSVAGESAQALIACAQAAAHIAEARDDCQALARKILVEEPTAWRGVVRAKEIVALRLGSSAVGSQLVEALETMLQAWANEPSSPALGTIERAHVELALGQPRAALASTSDDGFGVEGHVVRAQAFTELAQPGLAAASALRALAMEPYQPEATLWFGRALLARADGARGDRAPAQRADVVNQLVPMFREALAKGGEDRTLALELSSLLIAGEHFEQAQEVLVTLREHNRGDYAAALGLAKVAIGTHDSVLAQTVLAELEALGLPDTGLVEALQAEQD